MREPLSPSQLLTTSGMNIKEIHDRLDLIKNLLKEDKIEFSEKELEKLGRIQKKVENSDTERKNFFLTRSEKYFSKNEYKKLIDALEREAKKISPPSATREYWQHLRSSENFAELEEKIKKNSNFTA